MSKSTIQKKKQDPKKNMKKSKPKSNEKMVPVLGAAPDGVSYKISIEKLYAAQVEIEEARKIVLAEINKAIENLSMRIVPTVDSSILSLIENQRKISVDAALSLRHSVHVVSDEIAHQLKGSESSSKGKAEEPPTLAHLIAQVPKLSSTSLADVIGMSYNDICEQKRQNANNKKQLETWLSQFLMCIAYDLDLIKHMLSKNRISSRLQSLNQVERDNTITALNKQVEALTELFAL